MRTSVDPTVRQGLFIDIEAVPGGEIFGLGVTYGDSFRGEALNAPDVARLVSEVRPIAAKAGFIAGHNIIAHDLPVLDAAFSLPELKRLPAIDTLYLSPLAFPRNPYHRLTKNDRLVRSSKNHPARDCDSSRVILEDSVAAFASVLRDDRASERLRLTRWLLARAELPWNGSAGLDLLFAEIGIGALSDAEATASWTRQTDGFACPNAAKEEWNAVTTDPSHRATLAYLLAWLPVAGADSVLPAWVRHRFPKTAPVIRHLRSTPCADVACPWCSQTLSPNKQLQRFFGYPAFRAEPALAGKPGVSLQEEIVRRAMADESVLGILPTGGGKSLCFQVPALHRFFTTGALTIVLTPLQALMKDQVDGLIEKTSTTCVASLNGMQTPPEKAEVREAVRLGSIGILYVSPEQVRNSSFKRTIMQREIGCWVFDEAHCLSQWGHDFRPDYVYVARFIREFAEEQHVPVPPVMCVTATAKEDVKSEIVRHFQAELGQSLVLLDGGTERQNLSYRIEKVTEHDKPERLHALLTEKIGDGLGAAVVFAATRKRVKEYATRLAGPSYRWSCAAFHAGLSAEEKKAVLDDYLGGRLQVVVATNAFGMGIDKPNIRLVVHVDTPGSLESYLQEAGRAGRDREPAECVLLYNPEDLETQFGLLSMSKIEKRDIDHIWRAILRADRGDDKPVTLTVTEILDDSVEPASFVEEEEEQRGAKVRTAIAVLEKQGFLKRDENQTKVFQARPLLHDEDAIKGQLASLELSESKRSLWLDVMRLLLAQEQDHELNLDDFAELPSMKALYSQMRASSYARVSPYAPVFQVLNEMARPEVALISKDLLYSARLRTGRTGNASQALKVAAAREYDLIQLLRDEEPNPEGWVPLALRRVNQALVTRGHKSLPDDVIRTLRTLASDGRKMGRPASLLEVGYTGREHTPVRVGGSWAEILELSMLRNAAAAVLIQHLVSKARLKLGKTQTAVEGGVQELIPKARSAVGHAVDSVQHLVAKAKAAKDVETAPKVTIGSASHFVSNLKDALEPDSTLALVDFSEAEAIDALRNDMTLNLAIVHDLPMFVQYLLVYLHDSSIIELKNGKALISQAMSLRVLEKRRGKQWRRFTKGDYSALLVHYSEKIFQIHVMGEYARVGVERLGAHLRLISAYFEMGKAAFAARFLRERPEIYERATGLDSFRRIVDELRNPIQQAIVAEPANSNMLILAGPGSGKTRVVAHRCAYLLRVERIRPERILVACFNRHAALQLRRQIFRLVGKDAYGVMIQTYHGLALRLMGRSLAGAAEGGEPPDFGRLLEDATGLLTGKGEGDALRGEETRDRILARFSHILVDEYQDVDEREYAFISAIAGRAESEEERKLSILAVGDDDQSIYGFKGANVRFIRRFQEDYRAREHYLTENYRSTKAIITAANRLIAKNSERMKIAHAIRVNRAREGDPIGGRWEELDALTHGKIQRVVVVNELGQGRFVAQEIKRLAALDPNQGLGSFAVIARTREDLVSIRAALDDVGVAVDWRADDEMPVSPFRVREVHAWLSLLGQAKHETWTPDRLRKRLHELRGPAPTNRWWRFLEEIWSEWAGEAGEAQVPVTLVREFFVEAIAERRRHHRTSDGVVLVTAHKAKGLEFPHVFVADGGWRTSGDVQQTEEERRVYYVAMTRSRETLTIMVRRDSRTRFVDEIGGPDVVTRSPREESLSPDVACRRYSIIEPAELFISYPASIPQNSAVHAAIGATQVGDRVVLVARGKWIHVETAAGIPIAALSEAGRKIWSARLGHVQSATVTAMVRRTIEQEAEDYRAKAQVHAWEFPIVEVCWSESV